MSDYDEDEDQDDYEGADYDPAEESSLVEQTADAWRSWVRQARDGRPDIPGSLLGQLLLIHRATGGHPAEAIGVTADTYNRWLLGARGMAGGTRPSAASRARIEDAARRSRPVPEVPIPRDVVIYAVTRWGRYDYVNAKPDRKVHYDDLALRSSFDAWRRRAYGASAAALFAAIRDRYGVPVYLEDVEAVEFLQGRAA